MDQTPVRDAAEAERPQALQLALSEQGPFGRPTERLSRLTHDYLRRCGGVVGGLHLLETHAGVAAACAVLDLPGGVSLILLPAWALQAMPAQAQTALLSHAAARADSRGRRFIQILLTPPVPAPTESALRQAGYLRLASLRYMQRAAFDPAMIHPVDDVTWLTLREADEQTFTDVILRTYIDTRDCPHLTGVRSMAEVLAGHRGTGEFSPDGWYLLRRAGREVAVVLTARVPFRNTLELVYTGVVPEARRQGLGRLCVHRAILRARDLAVGYVTLAMDAANEPAHGLYTGVGFLETGVKDAWIRIFRRADHEALFELPAR